MIDVPPGIKRMIYHLHWSNPMPPTFKIESTHICEKCNNPMTVTMSTYDTKQEIFRVYIAPCKTCEKAAEERGKSAGIDRAIELTKS